MSDQLYHEHLVALARTAGADDKLDRPHGAATRDNPLCGDKVTVEVRLAGDRVERLAQRARGCILCRAASAAIAAHAEGMRVAELRAAARSVARLLTDNPPPDPPWPELAAFQPARGYPSRHGCVLLPFDGLVAALADAERAPPEKKSSRP